MARRPFHVASLAAFTLTACLLLPPSAGAQKGGQRQAGQAEEEPFFGSVDVNVVNVEVFVTDKDGKFVPGLTKDDFEIYEDGKPVPVTNFYAAEGATPATEAPGTSSAPQAIPEEQRLFLTVFFDNQSLTAASRNRMVDSIQEFVRTRLGKDDQVMVVSYEGPGAVVVRQAATRDPQAVTAALDKVAKSSAGGFGQQADFRGILRDLGMGPLGQEAGLMAGQSADATLAYDLIKSYAQRRHTATRNALEALGQYLDALSGLPGRKALLYVSGGMSLRPAQALFSVWQQRYAGQARELNIQPLLEGFDNDTTSLFRTLGDRANANRITFYTLALPTAQSPGSAAIGISEWKIEQEQVEQTNAIQSLNLLTAPTGGLVALDPGNADRLLGQMRDDFDNYYSLGYTPAERKKPDSHKIEVKVKRPGLKVRHRQGYQDRTTQERLHHQTMAALMLGAGSQNPLNVRVRFEQEKPSKNGQREVSVVVMFPMAKLALLPQDKIHQGRITLLVGARDSRGRNSDMTRITVPIRIPEEKLAASLKSVAAYKATVALRPGPHRIVVGVRDEYGNLSSVVTVPYDQGAGEKAAKGQ